MLKAFIVILVGLIGLVIGINLQMGQNGDADKQQVSIISENNKKQLSDIQQQLQNITTQLRQANQERAANVKQIKQLKQKLTILETDNKQQDSHSTQMVSTKNGENTTFNNASNSTETQAISAVLTKIGIDPVTIANIEKRDEKKEMKQLYLRNQAIREGWFGTEKYFNKTRELEKNTGGLREELGDTKYDEYLYTSGKFNRIEVSSVLSASPAEQSGLMAGDVIYSYDGKRVFSWSDITALTAQGKPGDPVDISILRDNVFSKFSIPRGPMGVRLQSIRIDPEKENL